MLLVLLNLIPCFKGFPGGVVGECLSLSRVQLLATPWTIARQDCQALLSMGFSRQGYWSKLPFPSPGDLPNPGTELVSPVSADKFFTAEPPGMPTRGYPGFKAIGQSSFCCCSVAQSCRSLCDPIDCSTPGFPVHRYFPEFAQTHVHRDNDAIQPSHPLSPHSPSALNPSHYRGLF